MSLARGAACGTAWNFVTMLFEGGFGFLIVGVRPRFIPASAVRVVANGSAISDLVRMLAVGGAAKQVQAAPGDKQIEAGAFWTQMLASFGFICILMICVPAIGGLYGEPLFVPISFANTVVCGLVELPSAIAGHGVQALPLPHRQAAGRSAAGDRLCAGAQSIPANFCCGAR